MLPLGLFRRCAKARKLEDVNKEAKEILPMMMLADNHDRGRSRRAFLKEPKKKRKKYELFLFKKTLNKTGSNVVIHHMSHQIPRIAKWPIYRGGTL